MTAKSKYYKMTEGDDLTLQLTEFPPDAISIGTDADGNPHDATGMIATYPISQELFPISAGDHTGSIQSNYSFGFAFAPKGSFTVTKMRIMCITAGGTSWPIKLGIFNATWNGTTYVYTCIGVASLTNPVQGLNSVNLDTPVNVEGGVMHYMALFNPGVNTFMLITNRISGTLTPHVVLSDPNDKLTVGATMTVNMATGSRIWMEISQ